MSEDDRAAKAARAKAMLKKRQQKKTAVTTDTPSRASTPAIEDNQRAPDDEKRDISDVFANTDPADTSWINSLAREPTPPLPTSTTHQVDVHKQAPESPQTQSVPDGTHTQHLAELDELRTENHNLQTKLHDVQRTFATLEADKLALQQELDAQTQTQNGKIQQLNKQLDQLRAESDKALKNEQQTIALLVSDKASLTADLDHYRGFETSSQETTAALETETKRANDLDSRVRTLDVQAADLQNKNKELEAREKESSDRVRDQDRQLQRANATITSLRHDNETQQLKLRELEEHIQSDDRADRLEESLKNTQERADDLEFQLSKLKQAHITLKDDRNAIKEELETFHTREAEWASERELLLQRQAAFEQQLSSELAERESMSKKQLGLETELESSHKSVLQLQEKFAQAMTELNIASRNLQAAQANLKAATARADDAEQKQRDLQSEGTGLMRSLDEMRPKLVELTDLKLQLGEKVESLEKLVQTHEGTIAELEAKVEDSETTRQRSEKDWGVKFSKQEKEHTLAHSSASDLQKAYTELQDELNSSLASIRTLESDRSKYHQDTSRRVEEVDGLTSRLNTRTEEINQLRAELDEIHAAQEEEQAFLDRAQTEVESLRSELTVRDMELERLRATASTPADASPRSLDDEMLGSLRQQHALELSTLQSTIRQLETSLFEAEARTHTLNKHNGILEEQLAQRPAPPRSFSPTPGRPMSRTASHNKSNLAGTPLARSVLDQTLSPAIRHKRKVSLSMLKARIESESAGIIHTGSRPGTPDGHSYRRPQILDESHIFWCHSCRGDLVIL